MKTCLAPMDGITDCAYRTLVSEIFTKYGDHNHELMLFGEFMSAEGYTRNPRKLSRHIVNVPHLPLIAQIYGGNGDNLIQTAIDIDRRYGHLFTGIELNIGCPSPKVMKCGWWAGMMCDRPNTINIVKQISESISLPFSIKTRIWLTWEWDELQSQHDFILQCAQYCSMITIHGRSYKQSHSGNVNRDYIYQIKSELAHTPVIIIGNGWLDAYQDGLNRCQNLDGVMWWQAAMMRPWVLTPHTPNLDEIYDAIMRHLHLSIAHQIWFDDESHFVYDGKYTGTLIQPTQEQIEEIILQIPTQYADIEFHSIVEFRKHLFWYVSWLIGNKEFKQSVVPIKSYAPLVAAIQELWSKQAT